MSTRLADPFYNELDIEVPTLSRTWPAVRSQSVGRIGGLGITRETGGFADSLDINDLESTGVGPSARNVRDGIRVSTSIGYLAPARNRLKRTIRGGCLAKRVVIENGCAFGVEVEAGDETQEVYGKRITLSAGS